MGSTPPVAKASGAASAALGEFLGVDLARSKALFQWGGRDESGLGAPKRRPMLPTVPA